MQNYFGIYKIPISLKYIKCFSREDNIFVANNTQAE